MKLISVLKEISCIFVVVTLLATSSQAQWVRIPGPQASATVSAMASSGQNMYVGTWRGMAVSSDNGISWQKCTISAIDTSVESIVAGGETIIVGIRNKGFLISTDKGGHWREIDSIFPGKHIQRVTSCSGVLLARDDESTFISFDNGVTWRDDQLGKKVNALAIFGSLIVAATNSHGIYRTSDSGKTWIKVNDSPNFGWLTTSGNLLFGSGDQGLFRSSDSGQTWVNISSTAVNKVAVFNSLLVAAPDDGSCVLRSSDNGVTWEKVKIDDSQAEYKSYVGGQLVVHSAKLYIAGSRGLFQSADSGRTWNSVTTGLLDDVAIGSLTGHGDTLFAGTGNHGVFRSTDGGLSWSVSNDGLKILNVSNVVMSNSTLFAATYDGIYCSNDNGTTWVSKRFGITSLNITSLASSGSKLFAGTHDSGLYISSDKGDNWVSAISLLPSKNIIAISAQDSMVVVKAIDSGLYVSPNNGSSWSRLHSESLNLRDAFVTDGHKIVAATYTDIIFSSDSGKTWSHSSLMVASSYFSSFVVRDGITFVGSTGVVHLSKDWGKNWISVREGFPSTYTCVQYIEAIGSKLFAFDGGLWVRPIAQMTDIKKEPQRKTNSEPITFNVNLQRSNKSEAFVEFNLTSAQQIKVTVCSPTGRVIKTLVNKYLEVGSYSYRWDLRLAGAGCYFIKMESASGIKTKKYIK